MCNGAKTVALPLFDCDAGRVVSGGERFGWVVAEFSFGACGAVDEDFAVVGEVGLVAVCVPCCFGTAFDAGEGPLL